MKKTFLPLLMCAAIAVPFSGAFAAAPAKLSAYQGGYSTFIPKGLIRNFTTVIPQGAKITYHDGANETTYTVRLGDSKIRIRALFTKDSDIVSRIQEKKWEMRDLDPSIRIIVEGQPVTLRAMVKGTLLVYQYRDAKSKASRIQRTLITSQGNIVYIIDCSAPTAGFYAYEQVFNIAMGGFLVTDASFIPPKIPDGLTTDAESKRPDIKIDQNELDSMGLKEEGKAAKTEEESSTVPSEQKSDAAPKAEDQSGAKE